MKTWKKMTGALLVLALACCAGVGAAEAQYAPGTYRGVSENGKNGPVVVEVTVSEDAIESVTVVEHKEPPALRHGAGAHPAQDCGRAVPCD
ncbi:MAG: FMN-binding protein [Clostridiales bacterium]|nr:FMN-binding protein [Clostridiales bacterium]